MEKTLTIIKPDAVAKGVIGEVIKRLEANQLKIRAMKLVHLTKAQAEGFYIVHQARPFYSSLTTFMSEGPVVIMALEGENAIVRLRNLMGPTDSTKAPKGTIRGDFGTSIERNAIHGSDSPESAAFEIGYFFNALEMW
jgi:nucleoside-diphosphate kinase